MIFIISAGGPVENYLDGYIKSLQEQTLSDFRISLVLDPWNDKSFDKVLTIRDDRLTVTLNGSKKGILENMCSAIYGRQDIKDDDILVWLDADDQLARKEVLQDLEDVYKDPRINLTYGTYTSLSNGLTLKVSRYEKDEEPRTAPWRATHLKTMRYKVFKRIMLEDLKDNLGCFFNSATDVSITIPALEMVGPYGYYVFEKPMVIYNDLNVNQVAATRRQEQINNEQLIRSRRPYCQVNFLLI